MSLKQNCSIYQGIKKTDNAHRYLLSKALNSLNAKIFLNSTDNFQIVYTDVPQQKDPTDEVI